MMNLARRILPNFHRSAIRRDKFSSVSSSHRPIESPYKYVLSDLLAINQNRTVRLGIDTMADVLKIDESLEQNYHIIHVGGTNGKGSTCFKTARALEKEGYRVGLFSSPHISSFRERICVNGEPVSEEEVVEVIPKLMSLAKEHNIEVSFFEYTLWLALRHFQQRRVHFAVIEVGLGGRLDATNVLDTSLSVLTSVGLDHTNILGNTVEEIMQEKMGIIKPKTPVICGPTIPLDMVKPVATAIDAPAFGIRAGHEHNSGTDAPSEVEMPDQSYDAENNAVIAGVLQMLPHAVELANIRKRTPLQNCSVSMDSIKYAQALRPPCRFQEIRISSDRGYQVPVILDVAHNPPAIEKMTLMLAKFYKDFEITAIVGLSGGRSPTECFNSLLPHVKNVYCVQPEHAPRSLPASKLQEELQQVADQSTVKVMDDGNIETTVKHVLSLQEEDQTKKQAVLVCGSFFIMPEIMQAMKIPHIRDPVESFH